MSLPLAVLEYTTDGGETVELVGCGDDYALIAVRHDCPNCISHPNAIDRLAIMLGKNGSLVVMPLDGSCCGGLHAVGFRDDFDDQAHKNILYLQPGDASKIFPPVDDDWWKTQRHQSRAPKAFKEVCAAYEALHHKPQQSVETES
jgi:hypothetical protein